MPDETARRELRYCDPGGELVDAVGRLPTDPCEFHIAALQAAFGCSRLRCGGCGAAVRSGPPGLGLCSGEREPAPALVYDAECWEDLPGTTAIAEARLYACRCSLWQCRREWESIDRDHETPTAPQMPWTCEGHPVPALPLTLGALDVTLDADWPSIVDRVLGGSCPRPLATRDASRDGPSIWLGWLHAYLRGLPAADEVALALAARVADPDPLVRGRVLHFFARFPRAPGVERVLAEAEASVEQVALGYPIPEVWTAPTLFDVIAARLDSAPRARDGTDERASQLLRRVMLVPLERLSHADLGPTDPVQHERASLAARGQDVTSEKSLAHLADYRRSVASQRVDVVSNLLAGSSSAFRDEALHRFIADHIVELSAAAPGRWRALMDLLAGWYEKPALGHLIVIAGASLVTRHAVTPADFRDWMDQARFRHRWMNDAWVLPLTSICDAEERAAAGPSAPV